MSAGHLTQINKPPASVADFLQLGQDLLFPSRFVTSRGIPFGLNRRKRFFNDKIGASLEATKNRKVTNFWSVSC